MILNFWVKVNWAAMLIFLQKHRYRICAPIYRYRKSSIASPDHFKHPGHTL